MTYHYSNSNWLDVLYNCVRKTPGGVIEAAKFLTERRGKTIHPESLRAKLRGINGEDISVAMAELLTEWMQEKAGGAEYARDWMQAFAMQNELAVLNVPPAPEGGWPNESKAIQEKIMRLTSKNGKLAAAFMHYMEDDKLCKQEKEDLHQAFIEISVMAYRGARNVTRA